MAIPKYEEWLQPEKLTLLEGWRRDGLTLEQIAGNIGVNQATLYKWRKNPAASKIDKALKKGDEVCVFEVENALYKSATGYDVEEIEITESKVVDSDGNLVEGVKRVTMHKKKRHIPPQIAAQVFLLKNRRPEKWKDKPEAAYSDDVENDGFLDALKGSAAEDWSDGEDAE